MEEGADLPRRGTRTKGDAVSQCSCVMCEAVRVGHSHADTMKAQRIRDAEAAVIAAAERQLEKRAVLPLVGASRIQEIELAMAIRNTEAAVRALQEARK